MTTTLTPDILVIGAGSAGLTVAAAAASFGHRVVLAERAKMGGDCLNYGCVPSKSVIAAARHAHAARQGAAFGVDAVPQVDFSAVHKHVHDVIAGIAPHDSQERFEGLGVTVLREHARFVDERTVLVGETKVVAKRVVIATGSRPFMPEIAGLRASNPLTNESLFDLTALPKTLVVIGGGPICAEMGQALQQLGCKVTILSNQRFLPREDPDAAAVVRAALLRDGVAFREDVLVTSCVPHEGGVQLMLSDTTTLDADRVLVAAGRKPNIEDMGLDAAGIETSARGIVVDKGLRTTNRRVFAIGDVAGGLQFTHVAGHQASLAVRAIVFRMGINYRPELMPRATYTTPELAQVGLTEDAAREVDPKARAFTAPMSGNDRARTEGETDGFCKIIISGKGKLMGATIVAPGAGEQIALFAMMLAANVPLKHLASYTPAYPTLAEAGKRAATLYYAEKLSAGWVKRVLALLKRLP